MEESTKRAREDVEDHQTKWKQYIVCNICLEVMHKPVMIIPCAHIFCGGCLSQWNVRANKCPTCREEGMLISEAPRAFYSMIDDYFQKFPKDMRTDQECATLQKLNKFSHGKLFRVHPRVLPG